MTDEEKQKLENAIQEELEKRTELISVALECIRIYHFNRNEKKELRIRMKTVGKRIIFEQVNKSGRCQKGYFVTTSLKKSQGRKNFFYAVDPQGRILPEEIVHLLRSQTA